MAEHLAFTYHFPFRHHLAADIFCIGTSCMEAAARRRIYRAGYLACEQLLFIAAQPWVCFWYGVKQEMGVWVQGMGIQFMGAPYLADHAQEHDTDTVRYELHHAQVMGNEQVGQLILFLQIL